MQCTIYQGLPSVAICAYIISPWLRLIHHQNIFERPQYHQVDRLLFWNISPKAHITIWKQLYINDPNSVTILIIYWLAGKILILLYPIFISNAVTYWKPFICYIVSPNLGNAYSFLTNLWLSLQYSVMNLTVNVFLRDNTYGRTVLRLLYQS